jgi:hypothetical protein
MIERQITIDGQAWSASLSGGVTPNDRDEFSLVFTRRDAHGRKIQRVSRFSPVGTRSRAAALAELADADLVALFAQSQGSWTSPELGYAQP